MQGCLIGIWTKILKKLWKWWQYATSLVFVSGFCNKNAIMSLNHHKKWEYVCTCKLNFVSAVQQVTQLFLRMEGTSVFLRVRLLRKRASEMRGIRWKETPPCRRSAGPWLIYCLPQRGERLAETDAISLTCRLTAHPSPLVHYLTVCRAHWRRLT